MFRKHSEITNATRLDQGFSPRAADRRPFPAER
jgi:hypothetical protein